MKVNWIVARATSARSDWGHYPQDMKQIGPIWGSWSTWMQFGTDNTVCHDLVRARELTSRAFHAVTNLYVYRQHCEVLNDPRRVHWYDGTYDHDHADIEDIIAMHLASSADMVLLLGFDFGKIQSGNDSRAEAQRKGMMRSVIAGSPAQWVAIDHDRDLDPAFANLANFTRDTMDNVLRLLS